MRKPHEKIRYYMFIDESGIAHLNNPAKDFVLSAVIINKDDFSIIEGYLKLLKRKFLYDDDKNLHATDLLERPYMSYRKLFVPHNNVNPFIHELKNVLRVVPYKTCIYHVDKQKICRKYGYKPAPGRKSSLLNLDKAYELAAHEAIKDFTELLVREKCMGEIVIESRLHNDGKFVSYFDDARKAIFPGGISNPLYSEVKNRIPSLFISSKNSNNGGLELADIAAHLSYRSIIGDPHNKIKVPITHVNELFAAIKMSAHKGTPVKLIHKVLV
ncbi:MAG TPA: DUF3800 domain-containing protein [Candidatus Binatia bacterium]|jgi:hypothetical protein|nr:DUF3800 domain-containing protein [Candidatus Binatia bacterium]